MSAVAENLQSAAADDMPAPLIFTDNAADKVRQLVEEEGNPDLKLRVFVQGGGCSGFQYGFTFAEIDYKDDLQGAQFVIKNPNATTTCGCGSSFSAG